MIHFDTSFLVDHMRESARNKPGPATVFLEHLDDEEEPAISVFVLCELYAGVGLYAKPAEELEKLERICSRLHVDYPDETYAPAFGRLLARLTRAGQTVSTMDLLIATSAILREAPLVTRNVKDFAKVPDLRVIGY